MEFKVPYVIFNMFMFSRYEDIYIENPRKLLQILIIYFISFYPYNVDDFDTCVENPDSLIFILSTDNIMSTNPCMYVNKPEASSFIKEILSELNDETSEIATCFVHLETVITEYEQTKLSSG